MMRLLLVVALLLGSCAGLRAAAPAAEDLAAMVPNAALALPGLPELPLAGTAKSILAPEVANGSFEVLGTNGQPAQWVAAGSPLVVTDSAAEGGRSVLVSRVFTQTLEVPWPVPQGQSFTLGASVRRELGPEQPFAFLVGVQPSGAARYVGVVGSSGPAGSWTPYFGSASRDFGATRLFLVLMARADIAWVGWDDVYLLVENPVGGDFEAEAEDARERAAWQFRGGAQRSAVAPLAGTASLLLPPGGVATRLVSHSPRVVEYFVTGRSDGALIVGEERLGVGGAVSETSAPLTLTAGRFVASFPASTTAHAARMVLQNGGPADVRVDDVQRGFTSVWPPEFDPVPQSPRPTVRLAAALPDGASLLARVRDSEGTDRVLLDAFLRDGSSAWLDWDGGGLPEGTYTVRFEFTFAAEDVAVVERPLRIRRSVEYPAAPAPFVATEFQRVAWLNLYPFNEDLVIPDTDAAEQLFRTVRGDGFNLMILFMAEADFPKFAPALERAGVPYIVSGDRAAGMFGEAGGLRTDDGSLYTERLRALDVFTTSTLFRGVYVLDEPNLGGADGPRRALEVARFLEAEGKYRRGFSLMDIGGTKEFSGFPVVGSHEYPIGRATTSVAATFLAHAARVDSWVQHADGLGRDYWQGIHAFSEPTIGSMMSEAEAGAQLGIALACGARGTYAFLYRTLNNLGGLRDVKGGPSRLLPVFQGFNQRVAALEPLLLSLPRTRTLPTQTNVVARVARRGTEPFLFLVNPDGRAQVEVTLNAPGVWEDLESSATLSVGDALRIGPGEWRILRGPAGAEVTAVLGTVIPAAPPLAAPLGAARALALGARTPSLAFSQDGTRLAAHVGRELRVLSVPPTDSLAVEATGTIEPNGDLSGGYLRWLDANTVASGSRRSGIRAFAVEDSGLAPEFSVLNRFGTGWDVLLPPGTNDAWISQLYYGVGLGTLSPPTGWDRRAQFFSENYDFKTLHGPFADGAILGVETTLGVYRLREDGARGIVRERLTESGVFEFAALSPNGRRLAVPASERGALVHTLDARGYVVGTVRVEGGDLLTADECAWVSEGLLAILDPQRGAQFFAVGGNSADFVGRWVPSGDPGSYDALATAPGRWVAVATRGGDLAVADVAPLLQSVRPAGVLFH